MSHHYQLNVLHDYAGTGPMRCLAPVAMPKQLARLGRATQYEVFTGRQYRHSVTGELHDVSWTETRTSGMKWDLIRVRCRICPTCTKLNSFIWAKASEAFHDVVMDAGGRSVAATLTMGPGQFRTWWRQDIERRALDCEANDAPEEAERLRSLPAPSEYWKDNREHIRVASEGLGRALTNYNKRLREHHARKPGILPRIVGWMAALEFGTKHGRPHLHVIYHLEGDARMLRVFRGHAKADWHKHVGFAKLKPVSSYRGCSYASKYIGKVYDADYRAFFERVGGKALTPDQSVEFARLKQTMRLQRFRTRSSLGYRKRGLPPRDDISSDCKAEDHHSGVVDINDYQKTTDFFCAACGVVGECACALPSADREAPSGILPECCDPPF